MTLIVLPTKADGSIGRVKNTLPEEVGVPVNLDYYETAEEHERAKTALVNVCAAVGLGDGSTAGSLEAMRVSLSDAPGLALCLNDGNGAFVRQRLGDAEAPPTADDDETLGYGPGSWWVQRNSESPAVVLWLCLTSLTGAAVWHIVATPASTAPSPVGRSAAVGTSATYAREDHVHDVGLSTGHETASFTLAPAHEIRLVDTTSGVVVVTLPSPAPSRVFALKKKNVGTNKITLRPHDTSGSGPTIEGGAAGDDYDLPDSGLAERGYWPLFCDGVNWWVME